MSFMSTYIEESVYKAPPYGGDHALIEGVAVHPGLVVKDHPQSSKGHQGVHIENDQAVEEDPQQRLA